MIKQEKTSLINIKWMPASRLKSKSSHPSLSLQPNQIKKFKGINFFGIDYIFLSFCLKANWNATQTFLLFSYTKV